MLANEGGFSYGNLPAVASSFSTPDGARQGGSSVTKRVPARSAALMIDAFVLGRRAIGRSTHRHVRLQPFPRRKCPRSSADPDLWCGLPRLVRHEAAGGVLRRLPGLALRGGDAGVLCRHYQERRISNQDEERRDRGRALAHLDQSGTFPAAVCPRRRIL